MSKIYYLIGQPGSGKTTIGKLLVKFLGEKTIQIDGDQMRLLFNNKDYTFEGRKINIQRSHDIARFLVSNDYDVVMSLVSPFKELRDELKINNPVIEIYLRTTEDRGRCQYRVENYEHPTENFVELDTTNLSAEESFELLLWDIL